MSGFIFSTNKKSAKQRKSHSVDEDAGAVDSSVREMPLNEGEAFPRTSEMPASLMTEPLVVSDTLSASVDLEDIIDNYDEPSSLKKSISSSLASLSTKFIHFSQTYFSATEGAITPGANARASNFNINNDETTSFYSALQDGFSLDDYLSSDITTNPNPLTATTTANNNSNNNSHILWADSVEQNNEKDSLMSPSHFQVYWSDLVYTIRPKITLFSLWNDLEQRFKSSLSACASVSACQGRRKFSINDVEKQFPSQSEAIKIIQQISGSFKSGELTAVMGPSGAGKTSLLNFLSRRREEGYNGELYVDTSSNGRIKISTIPQSDHLPEYLTVRENLKFASRLKNAHLANYDHEKNVERVSSLLGLDDCLDTRTKKISGGQHKRLAIAQELLSKPDILILDEPTSGLDSLTCYKTLTVLKNLVHASAQKLIDPIAIVLTIHQPQQEVFDLFDKIYIMANNGITIYDGPPNKCVEFVEKHTRVRLPDVDYNAASFMIEIASGEYGMEPIKTLESQVKSDFIEERMQRAQKRELSIASRSILNNSSSNKLSRKVIKKAASKQRSLELANELDYDDNNFDSISRATTKQTVYTDDGASTSTKSSLFIDHRLAKGSSMNLGGFWLKTRILILRCWLSMLQDPKQMIARILFHITLPFAMAFLMGGEPGQANACPKFKPEYDLRDLVYGESALDKSTQEELFLTLENIGSLFIQMYALICGNIAATTLAFTLDMQSSLKEYYNGWYSIPAYLLARIISTLPLDILLPLISMSISYPISNQQTGEGLSIYLRILITSLALILASMIGQTLGMIVGALYIGHLTAALFVSQAACLPLAFLSGFVVRTRYMSKLVQALSHLSIYKHALEIASLARYGFEVCHCKQEEFVGGEAKIVGVPEKFNQFTRYWMNTLEEVDTTTATTTITALINDTSALTLPATNDENKLFKLFAKQVSLYNTYGKTVNSCDDVIPYQLKDLGLTEKDIPAAFMALVTLLLVIKIILFVTVKLVVHFRTSL